MHAGESMNAVSVSELAGELMVEVFVVVEVDYEH